MRDHRVAGVGLVLDQHFPVAIVHVAQHAAGDFQPADRRAIDHVVDARQALAEIVLEVRAAVVQLREHEAAIILDVARPARMPLRGLAILEAGVFVALAQRHREQRAVGPEDQA